MNKHTHAHTQVHTRIRTYYIAKKKKREREEGIGGEMVAGKVFNWSWRLAFVNR